jgi:hypothetical protein
VRIDAAGDAGAGLAIAARRDVIPRAGKAPLFTVWTMRIASEPAPPAQTEPAIVVRDATGRRSDAFRTLRADMGMPP